MTTARKSAYRKIRSAIYGGVFEPGAQLTEEALCEFCGVSRTPVRHAIRDLAAEGVVHIGSNRRAYVSNFSQPHAEELFDILSMLESYSAGLAAIKRSDEQATQLLKLSKAMVSLIDVDHTDEQYLDLNSRFHKLVHGASGNHRLYEMIERIVDLPGALFIQLGKPTDDTRVADDHLKIAEAIHRRDRELASLQMKLHVERVRQQFRELWEAERSASDVPVAANDPKPRRAAGPAQKAKPRK